MTRTPVRLALPVLALAGALALSACGDSAQDVAGGSSSASQHGAGHGGSSAKATGNDADVAFLAGMVPHHEQAVEMSEIVLAADPPAEVAAIARQIQAAQEPEIEQLSALLDDLGQSSDASGHGGHDAHSGTMSDEELAELRAATGTEAARLYLAAMVKHHEGAIEASDAEIADGEHAPAIALARQIMQAQAEEIATMRALLATL